MKKLIKKFFCIAASITFIWSTIPYSLVFAAEETETETETEAPSVPTEDSIIFEGVEAGDVVEAYRLATYNPATGKYAWSTAVDDWLSNDGSKYGDLTPEKLMKLSNTRAVEFCQALLKGMKNSSEGIENINISTVEAEADKPVYLSDVTAGYYLILPKGQTRVYDMKRLTVESGKSYTLDFSKDYVEPTVTTSVENKTGNRGVTQDDFEYPRVINGDTVFVTGDVVIPAYPEMYSVGKRIMNVVAVVSPGLSVLEDSITVETPTAVEGVYDDIPSTNYAKSVKSNVTTISFEDQLLYYQAGGSIEEGYNYYNLDGSILKMGCSALEALSEYNKIHGTEYGMPGTDVPKVIKNQHDLTVIEIALNTDKEWDKLHITYEAKKIEASADTGFNNNRFLVVYSVSPLNANILGTVEDGSAVASYGIHIYLIKGDGYTRTSTTEEILSDYEDRITGVEFYFYKSNGVMYEGDYTENQKLNEFVIETDPVTGEDVETLKIADRLVFYEDEGKDGITYEYEYVDTYKVNENGEVFIAGIEPGTYLIEQANFIDGWKLAKNMVMIEDTDWSDPECMEGNYVFELMWFNYPTRFLPGTGRLGILPYVLLGIAIILVGLVLFFERRYKCSFGEIVAYLIYLARMLGKRFMHKVAVIQRKIKK